jgi:hypothetical protein
MSTKNIHDSFRKQALMPENQGWQPEQHVLDIDAAYSTRSIMFFIL